MPKIEEMTQEDVDRMQKALDDFKVENQKFRTQRDEYKAMAENNEVNAQLRERVLKAEAASKLAATGVKDADRFAKYIDFSKVEIGEDDSITGLDDQIESIKGDFADIFDPKKRVGGMADAGDKPAAITKPADPTSMQLDALLGNR
jgi:hypothetical protein